jgi:hypothetical protein
VARITISSFSLSSAYHVFYEEVERRREDVTKIVEFIKWLLTKVEECMMERQNTPDQRNRIEP